MTREDARNAIHEILGLQDGHEPGDAVLMIRGRTFVLRKATTMSLIGPLLAIAQTDRTVRR